MLQRNDLGWVHYRVYALAALTKEIRHGSLVYLGGNGSTLLSDFPNVLNVKIEANMESRIYNLIKRTDYVIDPKLAKRLIEEIDEKKLKWHRKLRRGCLLDPSGFDLVIEPGRTSIPEACELIRTTLEQPRYQTTPESLETIDLLTVAADLRARIAMKGDVLDHNVDVALQEGVIVIKGSVRSADDMNGIKELLDRPAEAELVVGHFEQQPG